MPPKALIEETRARLIGLTARLAKSKRLGAVHCNVAVGDPLRVILNAARRVDTIVMATLGRTGLSHLLIGSVAEKVVRHSPVPVLTIGSKAVRRLRASRPKRRRR